MSRLKEKCLESYVENIWIKGWMDRWINGWMESWVNMWMDE